MNVTAHARFVRHSPSKVRLVLNLIRGMHVPEARASLDYVGRRAADPIRKVLESALANAEHNFALDPDELIIAEAYANEGPTLKRFRPRARGRATQILKRTSHITVVLSDEWADEDEGTLVVTAGEEDEE